MLFLHRIVPAQHRYVPFCFVYQEVVYSQSGVDSYPIQATEDDTVPKELTSDDHDGKPFTCHVFLKL